MAKRTDKITTRSAVVEKKRTPLENSPVNLLKPGSLISNKMAELQAKYPAPGRLEEVHAPIESDDDFKL